MEAAAWHRLVAALRNSDDVDAAVAAAKELQEISTDEDVPQLLCLLGDKDFFVREAAAWPLAELGRVETLPQLFEAYQRGFDEGHDNDGFTAALIELASLHGRKCKRRLEPLAQSVEPSIREHATWLLDFCRQ